MATNFNINQGFLFRALVTILIIVLLEAAFPGALIRLAENITYFINRFLDFFRGIAG